MARKRKATFTESINPFNRIPEFAKPPLNLKGEGTYPTDAPNPFAEQQDYTTHLGEEVKAPKKPDTLSEAIDPDSAKSPKQICIESGGLWNSTTGECRMPDKKDDGSGQTEVFTGQRGTPTGVTTPEGNTYLGLGREDVQQVIDQQQAPATLAGQTQQDLSGQVGQFDRLGIGGATPVDYDQAVRQGLTASIPRAIQFAGGGALLGASGGPVGALVGAAAGFMSGISSGILSDMKSQRTDNTNAQKRTLDEGKQTLMDWVNMARSDPSNKAYYLSKFNIQLAKIEQAHSQMKFDTQNDLFKFESAIPDLEEFNVFYDVGGERDALVQEMRFALQAQSDPTYDLSLLGLRQGGQK